MNSLFLGRCSRFDRFGEDDSFESARLNLLDRLSTSDAVLVEPLLELPRRTPKAVPNLSKTAIVALRPLFSPFVLELEMELPLKVIASSLSSTVGRREGSTAAPRKRSPSIV